VDVVAKFLQHLANACADDSFVRLVLSSPSDPKAAVQRIVGRLVELRGADHLALTLKEQRRDTQQNVPFPEAFAWVERQLRGPLRGALLETTTGNWQLRAIDGDAGRLVRHKASAAAVAAAPSRRHDSDKPTYLGDAAQPWLAGLGLVDEQGRPRPRLADKLTQIDRYTEILAHLARDCGWDRSPADRVLRLVDVGCGKGHLTFAAWHLAHHVLQRPAAVLGVETRAELVEQATALADEVSGGELSFACGDIASVALPAADALLALHACDTATDQAIRRGVEARAELIVVAPCCHQQVRPQLTAPAPLAHVLGHGLFAERLAEWTTDALRTLVLEAAGYRVKAIEFVGTEHTGKNLLLAAVRRRDPQTAAEATAARSRVAEFRAAFGIAQHALDGLLDALPAN
jgi:SAM-dependent methyltransferase